MTLLSKIVQFGGPLGGYALARKLTQGQPKIIMHHHFAQQPSQFATGAEAFEQQLEYIVRHFTAVTVSEIANAIHQQKSYAKNLVAITVDDGYLDFYSTAFPLLKKYNLPATFYVATGFVKGDTWLWTDQLHWLFGTIGTVRPQLEWRNFILPSASASANDWLVDSYSFNNFLLSLPDPEKIQAIAEVAAQWNLKVPAAPTDPYKACNATQLLEMQSAGIEIGGHTVNHPSLGRVCTATAQKEIEQCYADLGAMLGESPRSFCYPNGQPDDYSPEVMAIVRQAGFTCAVTAFYDAAGVQNRWALRRHTGGSSMAQFLKSINGTEILGARLRRQMRKVEPRG